MNKHVCHAKRNKLAIAGLMIRFAMVILLFCAGSLAAFSQQTIAELKGIVVDENESPMQGVTVQVNGKSVASTKKDGSFVLHNVQENASLRFSYVGYKPFTQKADAAQKEIRIKMAVSSSTLTDVVVVNTGLYKKPAGSFTGAANTLSGEELKLNNPTNVLKALATLDPSLRIVENNALGSDPNSLPVIQLRGANNLPVTTMGGSASDIPSSISNGDITSAYLSNPNQPLIVLDGFQTTLQALYDLDINRIDKITILKDAAAAVAYGSKAANGVIVVETKRPIGGKLQISYAFNLNLQVADLTSYHLMNASELLEAQRLAGIYTDKNSPANDLALKQWYDKRLYDVQSGVNTYWLSQPVHNGFGSTHSLSMGGGNTKLRYNLTLSYNNGVGVMKGSNRNTGSISNLLSYNTKRFRLSNNIVVTMGKSKNSPWGGYSDYVSQFPYFKPYDSAGNLIRVFEPSGAELGIPATAPGGLLTNAMYNSTLQIKDYSEYLQFKNSTTLEYLLTNSIRLTGAFQVASQTPGSEQFLPAAHTNFASAMLFTEMGSYTQTTGRNASWEGRFGLDYNKRFGKTALYVSAGANAQSTTSSQTTVKVLGIPSDNLAEMGLANGYGLSSIKPASGYNSTRNMGLYLSTSVNYNERYVAELTVNASGSSQFGSNNRLAPFWGGGVAWNIDKEKFFKPNSIIQTLRLNATYGITGNQNFAAFMSQPIYNYTLTNNYRLQLGAYLPSYANPDLKWQQTKKTNFQLTTQLFKGAINISASYYIENTDNLILPISIPLSTGFTSYMDNLGATQNKGYEITISAPVIRNRNKNIFWSLSFNTGHTTNIIKSLSPAIEGLNKANNASNLNQKTPLPRFEVGESMSRIWVVRSLGIDPATGNEVFLKRDGTTSFVWDPVDKVPVGDAMSKFKGAFGSNLTWKGFTFNVTLSFECGGQMYNQTLLDKIENVDLRYTNADQRVLTDRWKQPGDKVFYKSLASSSLATNATSRFVQDNNYIDASSITLGYAFPSNMRWVKALHISTPRLFITQNNLFRISNIKVERGTSYPFARSFAFGLNTTF